ncbi:Histidine biosynthesis bifunctional protein hisB [Bacidia gigantensis]|uniref:Histidine biosynthesis bifunctional protein hisB n=1 Tax=Bacidia gigantensis TaxID=2732470 RepID=UPI001D047CC7|nr:Histidine biosynthesis bifunctional protein hisB [Bacidia gigantensis]KAG8532179.1 Histidine biosynthesis bifunctional protein hisB [Bacidia gigantensis]
MTRFRPCIDLHTGQVKQIVGGTLSEQSSDLRTNHVSSQSATHFANIYMKNGLTGGHVIMLGPGNEEAAQSALHAWPGWLQVGGGINEMNASVWIGRGAEKVGHPQSAIHLQDLHPQVEAKFLKARLESVLAALSNDSSKLVIDLSCRRQNDVWIVAMNKWQTLTDMEVNAGQLNYAKIEREGSSRGLDSIKMLEPYCSEFLIHAADNEGLQRGIDEDLVRNLGQWCSKPVTYAGGGRNLEDLEKVKTLSNGKVDLTIGSALDIFGGNGIKFAECVEWNGRQGL